MVPRSRIAETDPLYKGVRLPLAFWKVVVHTPVSGGLAATAYVLEQGAVIDEFLAAAVFRAGMYRVTLAHLMERTGLDFHYLSAAELPLTSDDPQPSIDRVPIGTNYAGVVV